MPGIQLPIVFDTPPQAVTPALDQSVLDALPVAACHVSVNGRIAAFNDHWADLMVGNAQLREFARREVHFLTVCKLANVQGVRSLGARVLSMLRQSGRGDLLAPELSCEFIAGSQRCSARVRPLAGALQGCLVVCEDVTRQRRTEDDLERLQTTQEVQRQSVVQYALLAQFGQYVLGSPPLNEITERLVEAVCEGLGAAHGHVLLKSGVEEQEAVSARRGREPGNASSGRSIEIQIAGKEQVYGTLRATLRASRAITAENQAFVEALAGTVAAYMERKSVEDRLAYMAQFDALTGLPNRTLYLDRLAHAIDEAGREQRSVAVLFVDIDRFKAVNDTLGHAVGDELLVQIASRLRATVRSGDTIGRLSGDEFALVLPHIAHADRAGVIGQKITAALSTPFEILGHAVYVSGSVGISLYPIDGEAPETLLKNADLAMYRAKQSGRNGYQFYLPQLQEKAFARLTLETRLRAALEHDQFELWYQPKVDLRTGELSGLEALLRWRTPEGEVVEPGEFISVLEETGLIIPVGERVVSKVCAQLRAWQQAGMEPPPVAINLSARQFRQDQPDVTLTRPILDSGVDPRLIEFELTESMLMGDAEGAIETLRRIKEHGIRLALDDFGTGYSSLHYLKLFPLDALKIDKEFIHDMLDDPNNARIVAAIVSLARNLDMQVVAEGVETARQLAFLRRQGCNQAQGFGLSPPLPVDEVTRLLPQIRRRSLLGQPLSRRRRA